MMWMQHCRKMQRINLVWILGIIVFVFGVGMRYPVFYIAFKHFDDDSISFSSLLSNVWISSSPTQEPDGASSTSISGDVAVNNLTETSLRSMKVSDDFLTTTWKSLPTMDGKEGKMKYLSEKISKMVLMEKNNTRTDLNEFEVSEIVIDGNENEKNFVINEIEPETITESEKVPMWKSCPNPRIPTERSFNALPGGIVAPLVKSIENAFPKQSGSVYESLVKQRRGNIPVIFTIPHGSTIKDPSFAWQRENLLERTNGSSLSSFQAINNSTEEITRAYHARLSRFDSDTNTFVLGEEIFKSFVQFTKGKYYPYVIWTRANRKFVDVNRRLNNTENCCKSIYPKCTAVADLPPFNPLNPNYPAMAEKRKQAIKIYHGFHYAIQYAIRDILNSFPDLPTQILLIDIHAHRAKDHPLVTTVTGEMLKDYILSGTQDGRCIKNRTEAYEDFLRLLQSELGSFSLFRSRIGVYPPNPSIIDHPQYNGGHITGQYGASLTPQKVDAFQFEFGYNIRMNRKTRIFTAKSIAKSVLCSKAYIRNSPIGQGGGNPLLKSLCR